MPLTTFLDGRPYTRLRGAAWIALSDNAHVLSGSITDDAGGGGSATWVAGGTVPARVTPLPRGREGEVAGGISDRSTHIIYLPPGTPAGVGNRIAVENRGTFEVTAVRDRSREWVRAVEVFAV